jgi:predicted acetyltransferase
MPVEFRAIRADELDDLRSAVGLAFGFDPHPDDHGFSAVVPLDRTRCGFDNGRIISTSAAFSLEMTVPGGVVPCGGTTIVSVSPTHRRRGVMREMMRSHLDDVRDHEEPLAALWATDSAIYGRFGFGCAAICHEIEVKRAHVDLSRLAPEPAPVRPLDVDEAAEVLPSFFDSVRGAIPGFYARDPQWWEHRHFSDLEHRREGMTKHRYVVVDSGDGIAGYAQYRSKFGWDEGHPAGHLEVLELIGTTPESWAGLWAYVLNHDLLERITADIRPSWDPLFDLLAGTRRVAAKRSDSMWVRIMDVPAALTARAYSGPVDLVLSVSDPIGDTTGAYQLRVDGGTVECAVTGKEPDVTLDLEDLSACYMGRARFRELARAGRVSGDGAALAELDRAFTWDPQPWCPEVF